MLFLVAQHKLETCEIKNTFSYIKYGYQSGIPYLNKQLAFITEYLQKRNTSFNFPVTTEDISMNSDFSQNQNQNQFVDILLSSKALTLMILEDEEIGHIKTVQVSAC